LAISVATLPQQSELFLGKRADKGISEGEETMKKFIYLTRVKRKEETMKTVLKGLMAVVMGFALVTSVISCASTSGSKATFLGEYAKDLQPGPKGGVKERWLKPGINFAKYNKVILEHVVFFFADDSPYKGIDSSELNQLAEQFDLAIVNVLKGSYPIVTEPGPDVVRIRIAITDLKQSTPALGVVSTVTMVTPVGLGVGLVKRGATGSWSGSGATSAEFLAFDSMTSQVIVAARDDRGAGFTDRYTKWGSAEEAFKFWAERIKMVMDQAHGVKR
jgi:hypothetical protein